MNVSLNPQKTPHILPYRASYVFCGDSGENRPRYNGTTLQQGQHIF